MCKKQEPAKKKQEKFQYQIDKEKYSLQPILSKDSTAASGHKKVKYKFYPTVSRMGAFRFISFSKDTEGKQHTVLRDEDLNYIKVLQKHEWRWKRCPTIKPKKYAKANQSR